MNKKVIFASLLPLLALAYVMQLAHAATIPTASLDKATYLAGQTGYISVSIYNDKGNNIRVTELTATINYYYEDETPYVQKFLTSATLPDVISMGQTKSYIVPISLPTNIAHGYTNIQVEARTDLWNALLDEWRTSDRPNYTVRLYVESPYKELYANLTNITYMLAVTSLAFAGATAFLMFMMFGKRSKPVPQQ